MGYMSVSGTVVSHVDVSLTSPCGIYAQISRVAALFTHQQRIKVCLPALLPVPVGLCGRGDGHAGWND